MSKLETNTIDTISGSTNLTLGGTNATDITIPSGVTVAGFKSTGIDDNATSTAIAIASNDKVGIGTSSPAAQLHISGSSSTDFDALTLRNADGTTNSAAVLGFEASSGTIGDDASLAAQIKGVRTGSGTNGALTFWTNNAGTPAERMRIDNSGNVGIGTTNPTYKFHLLSTATDTAIIHSDSNNSGVIGMSILAGLDTASSSGDCKWIRLADGDDSGKAYIQFKSTSPNAEFAAISDERLKTNIQDTDVVGLDVINNLRLVKFDWNETATRDAGWSMIGHQKLGFVAQEVEQILPEFISEDTNGFKIMGDSGFIPYLIKAMQEQQTKIQELEARITALENA